MDKWVDGWTEEWMNGCKDKWIDGRMDGWKDEWTFKLTSFQVIFVSDEL